MDVRASYFVCFTSRSGSTLLCEALSSTGVAGRPEEYFNIGQGDDPAKEPPWKAALLTKPLAEYIPIACEFGTTPNGVFGSKLHLWHLQAMETGLAGTQEGDGRLLAERLREVFPNPRYIWITRRDKVRQAVSAFKGKQSRAWTSRAAGAKRPLAFNFPLVEASLRQMVREEAAWAQFFTDSGIVPYTVIYEDLVRDYEATLRGVLDFLDIPLPEGFVFPAPRLRKQADALSEIWVRRYYEWDRMGHRWRLAVGLPTVLWSESLRNAYLMPRVRKVRNVALGSIRRIVRSSGAASGASGE
ncbi:MAG TPA: Stf0 family sulfotransferase [Chloroflexota bacterium]|nr:Stf0 family sulfotransferase [Chloroflexota bacterium]